MKRIQDPQDYIQFTLKKIETINDITNYELVVSISKKPLFGNGYFLTSDDNMLQMTCEEYIAQKIMKFRSFRDEKERITKISYKNI